MGCNDVSTHKNIDIICCVAIILTLILTVVFMNGKSLGIQEASNVLGYESRLFNTGVVHTIDIVMDDWEGFLETCTDEEYALCSVLIDGEAYSNVAIRAKGNTSLTQVANYGNDRYSFKIEFDHYDSSINYYGLDKLSLNNIIQDNTYMKDYMCYQMMAFFGVDAPLCSYVYITVNGEDWGLYLAVEGVEEAFLERNYGNDYGELYKPDSMDMGGGRGNGGGFNMGNWSPDSTDRQEGFPDRQEGTPAGDLHLTPDMSDMGGMGGSGSSDVSLSYTDDDYSSYSNIFDNAKTDITDTDKGRLIASLKQLNEGDNIEEVVDVDEVIRYFVVHNFVCNFDSYTGSMIHNYYLYEENGQLSMIPWDYNLAFGGFMGSEDATELVNYPIDTPVSGGSVDSRPMLAWIFSNEEYTQLYHQYFSQFITEYFDSGYFAQMMDEVIELISPYVEKDPTAFCNYDEFETGVATLREFCLVRAESVSGQLEGAIPSTSEGQSQDSSALIDASGINISDMGGMNVGGDMGTFSPEHRQQYDTAGLLQGSDTQTILQDEITQEAQMEQPSDMALPESETMMPPDQTALDIGQSDIKSASEVFSAAPAEGMQMDVPPALPSESGETAQQQTEPEASEEDMGAAQGQVSPPDDESQTLPQASSNGETGDEAGQAPGSSWSTTDTDVVTSNAEITMLGACAVVLLGGIVFAALYRKRS